MGHIRIEEDRCKGCELCAAVCPRQLIHISKRINRLGYHPAQFDPAEQPDGRKGCTGCAVCGLVCPETAIDVYR